MNTICHDYIVSESSRTEGGTTLNRIIAAVEMITACNAGFSPWKPVLSEGGPDVIDGAYLIGLP